MPNETIIVSFIYVWPSVPPLTSSCLDWVCSYDVTWFCTDKSRVKDMWLFCNIPWDLWHSVWRVMLEIVCDIFPPIFVSRVKDLTPKCNCHNYFRSLISDSRVVLSSDCLHLTATLWVVCLIIVWSVPHQCVIWREVCQLKSTERVCIRSYPSEVWLCWPPLWWSDCLRVVPELQFVWLLTSVRACLTAVRGMLVWRWSVQSMSCLRCTDLSKGLYKYPQYLATMENRCECNLVKVLL